jgi:alanyl-tRNA synthetase
MVTQGVDNIYDTDLFKPVIEHIKLNATSFNIRAARIMADHIRTAVFLITDGVSPSNTDRGYVLRRLLRRAIRFGKQLGLEDKIYAELAEITAKKYQEIYSNVLENLRIVQEEVMKEMEKFGKTLERGIKEFGKGTDAFTLFTSYGFPLELITEIAKEKGIKIDVNKFNAEMKKHQDLSRVGAEQKFKGGLADANDPIVVRYHTATHLLHQALHDVLGEGVGQKGSNITSERLRFDFSYPTKMTDEEKKKVENIVNEKISEALPVNRVIMPKSEAEKTGARHFFGEKYGDEISIYYIGSDLKTAYSKEFCGGPHVKNTSELGKFKIVKEEAVSAGVRRIKATLNNK